MLDKLISKFGRKNSRVILSAVIIALVIITLATVTLSALIPSSIGKFDITKNNMYTLSDLSRQIASDITGEIKLYLVASESTQNTTIKTIMERYAKENSGIKVELLDPESSTVSKYYSGTPETNSIIVASDIRGLYIPYLDLFNYTPEAYDNTYYVYTYYYNQGIITCSFTEFLYTYAPSLGLYDGFSYELRITSALKYVSEQELETVYMMLGHSEEGVSSDIANRLALDLFNFRPLTLKDGTEIPENADCILLMPMAEITEYEYNQLSEYLKNGGKLTLVTSYTTKNNFENLLKLTGEFGLTTNFDRYLCEDDENYNLMKYPELIVPDISDKALADYLEENKATVLLGGSNGITTIETEGITFNPLLTTSPKAYEKEVPENSTDLKFNEETDVRGSYYTGIRADNSSGGSIVWISSGALTSDVYDCYTGRGNKLTFMNIIKTLTESPGAPDVAVTQASSAAISVEPGYMYTVLAIFAVLAIGTITVGVFVVRKK